MRLASPNLSQDPEQHMRTPLLDKISAEQCRDDQHTRCRIGDLVRVHVKIKEGEKERIQAFHGTIIARDGTGSSETITVRRISHGEGVEKVFPLHSPNITRIEVERSGHVRRAKLYYLRQRTGRRARIREKRLG
jgi:large subunit ribosomal protein L19